MVQQVFLVARHLSPSICAISGSNQKKQNKNKTEKKKDKICFNKENVRREILQTEGWFKMPKKSSEKLKQLEQSCRLIKILRDLIRLK